jgi:beta-lactamase regulating signal transducer with metallopeptidase domain
VRRAASPGDGEWTGRIAVLGGRMGLSSRVRVLSSALVRVPCAVGALHPVILVPVGVLAGLSPNQLEAILAHELAHIRRHDYLANLLQTCVETVLFYHPAVWWVSGRVRAEREHCCDDAAVRVCGDAVSYARALATLEAFRGASGLAMAASGGPC